VKKYDASIRRRVLTGAVALAAVVTFVFGINALSEGLLVLAVVDLSVSAFSVGVILAMHKRPGSMVPNWVFTVVMTSFFVYLFASGGHGGTGLLFMLLIPLATPLFLGWKGGVAVSLVGLAACVGVAIWGSVVSPLPDIPAGPLLARMSAIYLVALVLAGMYDSGMQRAYREETRAKEALQESEERYRALFGSSLYSVYIHDFEGNFLDANEAALKMLGYDRQGISGLSFASLLSDDQLPTALAAIQRIRDNRTPREPSEFRLRRKDGSHVDVDAIATLVYREGEPYAVQGVARDVTERKRAEEALRQSEERYRTILDETGDGYFELDLAGRLTFVNDAMLSLLGCSREEANGLSYKVFAPTEEEAKAVFGAYNRIYKTGEPLLDYPSRIVRRDGSHGFGETSAFAIRNERGEIVGFRGVRRDITERKQAEEALRQSEERYRNILEEMEDSYFEVDLGGHITFVNSSTCRDLGYSKSELLGMSYRQFTAEEDIGSVFRMFNEVYLAGIPNKGFSWKTVRKDGEYGYAETSVSPLRNDEGEIIGFRGVGRDVGERRRAEEALKAQTAYFQQLFDSSPDAIVMMDTDDRVLRVNRGFEALFGYGAEEVTGRSLDEFIIPEDLLAESSISSQTVRHGGVVRKETERRRKEGSLVDVSVVGYPIEIDGGFVGMYVTYTDITERRQQAEQLIMADRLASVGELAAGTAHELNNPLTTVIGFSKLLMERDVPEDIREDLEIIHNEAVRVSQVTKNLLTFARKHAPVKQPNQVNSIIEEVLKLRAYEHRLSNIRVERRLSRTLPEVKADYFQMQQVFLNIVVNAEQVMAQTKNGGTLTITTRMRDGNVIASISDDGPGILREHLGQIFNPFFTTKEPGKGTGLGLSICYGIVTEHGGRIYAESEPGKGATFSVELPVNGVR